MTPDKESLDKLNKYAASLGYTLYRADYGFIDNGRECIHSAVCFNKPSERYLEFIKNQ